MRWKLYISFMLAVLFFQKAHAQEYRLGAEYEVAKHRNVKLNAIGEFRDKSDKNTVSNLAEAELKYKPFKFFSVAGASRYSISYKHGNDSKELFSQYRLSANAKLKTNTWVDDVAVSYRLKGDYDFGCEKSSSVRNKFSAYYTINKRAEASVSYEAFYSFDKKRVDSERYSIGSEWELWGKTVCLVFSTDVKKRDDIRKSSNIISLQFGF